MQKYKDLLNKLDRITSCENCDYKKNYVPDMHPEQRQKRINELVMQMLPTVDHYLELKKSFEADNENT